jgi:hypothetical protein
MPNKYRGREKEYHHEWYLANKERLRDSKKSYRREYELKNKAAIWEREFRTRFKKKGLPDIEIEKAIAAWKTFDGKCQACGKTCAKRFHTDHDHIRLIFRGIIGGECNQSLGHVKDSPERLRALANYLERFQ